MLSTIAKTVDWTIMQRKVYSSASNSMVTLKYLHLNLIDPVDLADQLRNCYCFNHWLRNRKWWKSIFLWAIGVAAPNAYKIYDRLYEEHKNKKKPLEAFPTKVDASTIPGGAHSRLYGLGK
jgi:hypothetical protein